MIKSKRNGNNPFLNCTGITNDGNNKYECFMCEKGYFLFPDYDDFPGTQACRPGKITKLNRFHRCLVGKELVIDPATQKTQQFCFVCEEGFPSENNTSCLTFKDTKDPAVTGGYSMFCSHGTKASRFSSKLTCGLCKENGYTIIGDYIDTFYG